MDMSINISLSFIVYWFSLCCAVFINLNVSFIYSTAYGHSIAGIIVLSRIKNGQSSTFFPLWVHNKAVHLLIRPTASVYSDHHPAGGDLVVLPRAEGAAGVCLVQKLTYSDLRDSQPPATYSSRHHWKSIRTADEQQLSNTFVLLNE